jgi:uncharacterized protein (DUF433 family)
MSVLSERLLTEIESAPEPIQAEVLDFVLFVKARHQNGNSASKTGPTVQRTPGVCGGEACVGDTRIAVWMLEEARRLGVGDSDLLSDYPALTEADLSAAWDYVSTHAAEIDKAIRENNAA